MLSENDISHLKLLYEKYHKMNLQIRELLKSNDFDSIEYVISNKENLLKQIMLFEKPRLDEIKQNDELVKVRKDVATFEKSNIELLKTLKIHLEKEVGTVRKAKKLLHTYEPIAQKRVSTFEIDADD
ncbi:MAG: hypothetical protein IJD57_00305 [Candidatus Gastranaerophilales bacterium]|nr:hypothetical protein [Candidatus Gastranaerophilales bacterium]